MKNIAVHHTAVENTGSPQLYAVNRYHKGKWNMQSRLGWYVGYNYFIDVDGTLTQTRAWSEETIANKGHNCDTKERCDTISVCLADNYNITDYVSEAQNRSLRRLIIDIKKHYPEIKVVGHRDLQEGRTCPGKLISAYEFLEWNDDINDPVDTEKEKEIALLQARLDSLKALLKQLLSRFK